MRVIFNSSLPRSGSTLLQNVLAQNPAIHCSGTSGVLELLYAARNNFTNLNEFKLDGDQERMTKGWLGFCRASIEGFYGAITDKPVACDKSRGWMYYWDWLVQFYPDAKLLCCVRDPVEILASMELLHRKNMHLADPADQPGKMQMVTVGSRVTHWLNSPPVGLGLQRLYDAVHKGHNRNFFFVPYDAMSANPERVVVQIYEYLGMAPFKHQFDQMEQLVKENDALHGTYGSHAIRPTVERSKVDSAVVLGKDVVKWVRNQVGWYYDVFK